MSSSLPMILSIISTTLPTACGEAFSSKIEHSFAGCVSSTCFTIMAGLEVVGGITCGCGSCGVGFGCDSFGLGRDCGRDVGRLERMESEGEHVATATRPAAKAIFAISISSCHVRRASAWRSEPRKGSGPSPRNNDDGIICGAMRQRGAGLAGAGVSSVAKG